MITFRQIQCEEEFPKSNLRICLVKQAHEVKVFNTLGQRDGSFDIMEFVASVSDLKTGDVITEFVSDYPLNPIFGAFCDNAKKGNTNFEELAKDILEKSHMDYIKPETENKIYTLKAYNNSKITEYHRKNRKLTIIGGLGNEE